MKDNCKCFFQILGYSKFVLSFNSKVVLGFRNFGYKFLAVGGDVWSWLCKHVRQNIYAHVDGGWAKGLACTDPGAKTNFLLSLLYHLSKTINLINLITNGKQSVLQKNVLHPASSTHPPILNRPNTASCSTVGKGT
jgi:hypothetical protein